MVIGFLRGRYKFDLRNFAPPSKIFFKNGLVSTKIEPYGVFLVGSNAQQCGVRAMLQPGAESQQQQQQQRQQQPRLGRQAVDRCDDGL